MADFDYNSDNEYNEPVVNIKGGVGDDDYEDPESYEQDEPDNTKTESNSKRDKKRGVNVNADSEDEGEEEEDEVEEEEDWLSGEEEDEDDDIEETDFNNAIKTATARNADIPRINDMSDDEDDSESEDEDEDYLQKLDDSVKQNIIAEYHPELKAHNYDEIETLATVVRNNHGQIIDKFHITIPVLTKYEKARILGERAKQINAGAKPFIEVEPHIIDGYVIAMKELEQKKVPFIISRPMPHGGCEYWRVRDLEILD
jgi:DNA-directed RNA polymerase I, II, and III subunit RPABC2